MAPRTRKPAPAAVVAQEEDSDDSPLSEAEAVASTPPQSTHGKGLKFSQPLTWRAGRPIPVADLLKRLQALAEEMRSMDQDEDEDTEGSTKETFAPAAHALANQQLLAHKDKGVRAWVACCAVDVLRLCAPEAPFSPLEMKAVFEMIFRSILPLLSDPSNAYNTQHTYVLQSLSEVKSVILVGELPSPEPLIEHLFVSFFDILSGSAKASTGEQLAKAVVFNMTSILVTVVDELDSLPQEVVDTIMAQFLRVDSRVVSSSTSKSKKGSAVEDRQSTLEMKELPPAYSMAKTICNTCAEKMSREVSKYFSDVIMEVTASSRNNRRESGDMENEDSIVGPSEEDMKELSKAHRLLRELWRASPAVLQNVIPQLEAELSAENVRLRQLATETLGDIISGIGAAGPPLPPHMDPAAYPPIDLSSLWEQPTMVNLFTIPSSPQSFPQTYSTAYSAFLGRKQDKSPIIRAAWTTGIGRVLMTSAGGVGLGQNEEKVLVEDLARMLNDSDEKVRLAAVRAVAGFSFRDIVNILGSSGSVDKEGSVLGNLSERVKDRKISVREEAMAALARIWGVASGEIAEGNEQVKSLIGGAPSKILNAFYTNDPEIIVLTEKALFETMLPLGYPPIKSKSTKATNGSSQRVKDSQAQGDDTEAQAADPDKIRVARILVLAKGLNERAKKVFFAISGRQVKTSRYMLAYLQTCEDSNGGVMDKNEEAISHRLTKLINEIAKLLPDPPKVAGDLRKFAEKHDRRSYQLLRFCMAPENDYRFVYNSIREFKKRIETSHGNTGLMETFLPLIYRSSILIYNKSHVPAVMLYSRTNEMSFASIAHEVLTDISQQSPEVLKANVKEICLSLQEEAPSATKANSVGAVDSLKACAAFARKFSDEIPQDHKFVQAMTNFSLFGSPPDAAKHAVSIIMAASKRKEMLAKDLVKKCVDGFTYGKPGFLSRLATLSRLCLLAPSQVDDHADEVIDIAIKEILLKNRTPHSGDSAEYVWSEDVDDECLAKTWAVRILVNRIRSHPTASTLAETARPVYGLLEKLVSGDGELSSGNDTPSTHKPRLRLIAARSYLKLCQSKSHEALLKPLAFQALAMVAQDAQFKVRAGFFQRLKKYLGHNTLPQRFYSVFFLLNYEPEAVFKAEAVTWLRSRAVFFAEYKPSAAASADPVTKANAVKVTTTLEAVFPRLLSLLAHHDDYGDGPDDLKELARYIVFYLTIVATESNVSLIFHVAQRVKACRDALSPISTPNKKASQPDFTARLHTLSDLSTLTLRSFIEAHGWTLHSLPARLTLPRSLFVEIKDHASAQAIAEKSFLPDDFSEETDRLVRAALRRGGHAGKKRKSEAVDGGGHGQKRGKTRMPGREKKEAKKTPKKSKRDWDASDDDDVDDDSDEGGGEGKTAAERVRNQLSAARRKSGRKSGGGTGIYRERESSEDDQEMEAVEEAAAARARARAAAEEDEEMPDADEEEVEDKEADEVEPEPASTRGKVAATPKSKGKAPAKATPRSAPKAKTNGAAKSSPAAAPERPASGRATRSRA